MYLLPAHRGREHFQDLDINSDCSSGNDLDWRFRVSILGPTTLFLSLGLENWLRLESGRFLVCFFLGGPHWSQCRKVEKLVCVRPVIWNACSAFSSVPNKWMVIKSSLACLLAAFQVMVWCLKHLRKRLFAIHHGRCWGSCCMTPGKHMKAAGVQNSSAIMMPRNYIRLQAFSRLTRLALQMNRL